MTRQEFAEAMAKVKIGMTKAEVRAILGEPDDIRLGSVGRAIENTAEIWCYGTDTHLGFPTLGRVCISAKGKVLYTAGGRGRPPPPTLFQEEELRRLLRFMDRIPSLYGHEYNPRRVIQIVNALQAVGKEGALAAIEEYLRVAPLSSCLDDVEGFFLVLRVLFDIPADPGYMPGMFIGGPVPPEPKDPRLIPRFPIILQDDIPVMIASGYERPSGLPQPLEAHVAYFRKHGKLRSAPLSPTDDPLSVLRQIEQSPRWLYGRRYETRDEGVWLYAEMSADAGRAMIRAQLVRLIDTVYRLDSDSGPAYRIDSAKQWAAIVKTVAELNIRWDPAKDIYTLEDGSHLPEPPVVRYYQQAWRPAIAGLNVRLIIGRRDQDELEVFLEENGRAAPAAPVNLHVYALGRKDEPLCEFVVTGAIRLQSSFTHSQVVALPEGARVQAEATVGGKSIHSPVYEP